MTKLLLTVLISASCFAQTTITSTGTIPAGTFENPLTFQAPLTRAGNSVSCPTCGGSSGGGSGPTLTPPVQSAWTAFNVVGMVQTPIYTNARWEFTTNASTGANIEGVVTAIPATPYSKILRIWPFLSNVPYATIGVGWANGTVGSPSSFSLCEIQTTDPTQGAGGGQNGYSPTLSEEDWTNTTTRSALGVLPLGLNNMMLVPSGLPTWFRLSDDGTNRTCDISWDGSSWLNVYTTTDTHFITPTQIVVSGNSYVSSKNVKVVFDSYQ